MDRREQLLSRLDAIADSLAASGHGRALLALGSVGRELQRLDDFSDLDFFAIVEQGSKQVFIEDLIWLERVSPLGYVFKNTSDGYKLMFADGILCEFAVFEESELQAAVYAPGRIIWQAADFDATLLRHQFPERGGPEKTVEWAVGEALTNLYVGLCRFRRGEKLTAMRFVQGYALDRLLDLAVTINTPQPDLLDAFAPERRFEQRFPQMAGQLTDFAQGYECTPQSALAILNFLDTHFDVNPIIRREILLLANEIK